MNATVKRVLVGYGIFCAVNAGLAYFWSRNFAPGANKLADFNTSLLSLNVLARLLPQSTGASTPATAAPAGTTTFLPATVQLTDSPGGLTTTFGN